MQKIEKEKKVALLSGDINCDTYRELSVNSALTQDFINAFASFNYHKLITQPTRVVSKMSHIKSATLLDNFYTSTKNWEDGFTGILNTDESLDLDHKAIFTITENASIPKLPEYGVQRDLCTKNIYKLNECYKNKDWNELYALETARDSCSFFILFVNNMFLICCPEKSIKITYHNRNPWIKKSLKQDIAEREKLLKIKTEDPSEENVSMFKKCRKRVIALQRKAEMDYQKEQLSLNSHDLRKSWKVLRQILGLKAGKNNCANTEFIIQGNVISDTNEIAKYFNNYFVNIGKSLSDKIHSNVDPLTYLIPNEHNLVLPITQEIEVRNIIMALKNTASGYDCIAGSIMKQCVDNYITPLTHIINLSIAQGYLPDEWKVAKVILIFKDGDPQDIQNNVQFLYFLFFLKYLKKLFLSTLLNF